jgi:hypothetical protein
MVLFEYMASPGGKTLYFAFDNYFCTSRLPRILNLDMV